MKDYDEFMKASAHIAEIEDRIDELQDMDFKNHLIYDYLNAARGLFEQMDAALENEPLDNDKTNEKYFCPVNGLDCPYYRKGGYCVIKDPFTECDDFAAFWPSREDYEDA